jgi:dTDP-4-amino-4,6-dideoxygalactose transaminase
MAKVPLLDLAGQFQAIRQEIDDAMGRVIATQQFILGPEVEALERELARYCQSRHCVGVSSGSDALILALMALEIGPGDEVITTPYTFFATAGSIVRVGATAVFVDIDPATYNIDPRAIDAAITPRTKAMIPVHLFGQCADMDPINATAARYGLAVIEDACQAIGAEYHGRRAGSLGTAGCFSFFPSKNLGAFGDAGAITTNNDSLAERIRCLRIHGSKKRYYHERVGGNFRLDALQAAVLRVKLKYLEQWTAARRNNASFYQCALSNAGLQTKLVTPTPGTGRHVYNQYVVRAFDRDCLRLFLAEREIGTEIYYPVPLHLQECFSYLGYRPGDLPHSEQAAASTLALPVFPELTVDQKQFVVTTIAGYYESTQRDAFRAAA